jgi:hypothetical protein
MTELEAQLMTELEAQRIELKVELARGHEEFERQRAEIAALWMRKRDEPTRLGQDKLADKEKKSVDAEMMRSIYAYQSS